MGEVDDRRDPPRQIEINFTRITRRAAYISIRSNFIELSSPFIACCFRRLILGSFDSSPEVDRQGEGIRVEGKWGWGRSVVVVVRPGRFIYWENGDLTRVVFVIRIRSVSLRTWFGKFR